MMALSIKLRQKKTGAYVAIPVTDELKAALDAAPKTKPDHADPQRWQAMEREWLSGCVGQGNHAGGNSWADVS